MKKLLSLAAPVLSSAFVGLTSFSVEAKPDVGENRRFVQRGATSSEAPVL